MFKDASGYTVSITCDPCNRLETMYVMSYMREEALRARASLVLSQLITHGLYSGRSTVITPNRQ
jgi:hypothetical protein